jgi:A/G-specific adenine glycosylase
MTTATDRSSKTRTISAEFAPAEQQQLRRRLLAWYAKHERDLPWRRTRDPYRVWVSEIMLQQTQVATVRDYFQRFVRAFPNVRQLAAADEQQVFRLWEGLGYYRRARLLHATAKIIVSGHGGQLPQNVDELQQLPGIGRYTAGAIASIAFDQRAAILEANTIRLLSRLIGYRGDPRNTTGQRLLWHTARDILPQKNVARFNQALMELGSLVCTPTEPECPRCPLRSICRAFEFGLQDKIPRAKPKQRYTEVREVAVVVRKNGRLLVRQCGADERWAGLWDFPRFAIDGERPLLARDEIVKKLRAQTGVSCRLGPLVKTIKHGVTRYRITLDCYRADYASGRVKPANGSAVKWLPTAALADLPLSTTGRKIAVLISRAK